MAITLVQTHTHGNSATSTTCSVTLSTTTTGNTLVIFSQAHTSTISSIADGGDTFVTTGVSQLDNSSTTRLEIWYAKNITGRAAPTLTVTYAGSCESAIIVREYSGLDTTAPLDKVASSLGFSSTPSSGATAATVVANELVVGGYSEANTTAPTAGSGYGNLSSVTYTGAGTGDVVAAEDKIVSVTGAQTATFSAGVGNWAAGVATFKAASVTPLPSFNKRPYQAVNRASTY